MSTKQFLFPARLARRLPDPIFEGVTRHFLFVAVKDVPPGLPRDPNPRQPNINRRVYREVEESLLDHNAIPGSFHLKHKGITVLADRVEARDKGTYIVTISDGQGILDGGHTDEIIKKHRDDEELPDNQFVKFEILTGVPAEWITEISGGLNTSMQVQPMSLDNKKELFRWIQEELGDQPYYKDIAWSENDPGEFDARDVIALLCCFNVYAYPNGDGSEYPIVAYSSKSRVLEMFEADQASYERLRPLLRDILQLYDRIRSEARDYHNAAGGRAGRLAFVEQRKRGEYNFPFLGKTERFRLTNGAAYPMLGAFRWMVEMRDDGSVAWRGGFENVLSVWRETAGELMAMTQNSSDDLGRNPMALGKSKNLWATLYKAVGFKEMTLRTESAPATKSGSTAQPSVPIPAETRAIVEPGEAVSDPFDEGAPTGYLEDELRELVGQTTASRTAAFALPYWGWDDGRPKTLEVVGQRFGVTRERVRQIVAKAEHQLEQQLPFDAAETPVLDNVLDLIAEDLPTTTSGLGHILQEAGLTRGVFDAKSLSHACRIFGKEPPFNVAEIHGIDFAMPVDSDDELFARAVETIEVALETAKALVRQAGAARVDDVVSRAASDSSLMLRREQLVGILSAVPGFAWLEKKRGWFWLSEVGKNVVVTRVTKILSVAPRIEVERLHEGIRRDYRTEDFVMPENVLLALCAQLAMCTVEGQTVVATEEIDPAAVLEGAEMELVRLLQTHGPIVDRGELKELADGAGIGEPSFYSRTRYSPVIEEFPDGRLGLRGA